MKTADELTALFRTRGLRVTPQRHALFRLLQGDDSHPTVQGLCLEARAEMPTISLRTVYQTIHDLEGLGEVALVDLGTGSVRSIRTWNIPTITSSARAAARCGAWSSTSSASGCQP